MIVEGQQLDGWLSDFFHNPLSTLVSTVKKVIQNPVISKVIGVVYPPAAPFLLAYDAGRGVQKYVEIKKQNATALLQAQGVRDAEARGVEEMKVFERDFVSKPTDSRDELLRKRKNLLVKLPKDKVPADTPTFGALAPLPPAIIATRGVTLTPFQMAQVTRGITPALTPAQIAQHNAFLFRNIAAPAPAPLAFPAPAPASIARPVAAPSYPIPISTARNAPPPAIQVAISATRGVVLTPQQNAQVARGIVPSLTPAQQVQQLQAASAGRIPAATIPAVSFKNMVQNLGVTLTTIQAQSLARGVTPPLSVAQVSQLKPPAPPSPTPAATVEFKTVDETPLYLTLLKANTLYLQAKQPKAVEPVAPVVSVAPVEEKKEPPAQNKGAALLIPAAMIAASLL